MAKSLWERLSGIARKPEVERTDTRPFVIFADQVGTMNKASAEALDVMCRAYAEQGVDVRVICQSEETSEILEENYEYWREGGNLRRNAFHDERGEIWHVRGEAGADNFLERHGDKISGYLKVQDIPNPQHRNNVYKVREGIIAENVTFAAICGYIDRATGARSQDNPIYRAIGPNIDGNEHDRHLLGGKGVSLIAAAKDLRGAENDEIAVPAAFIIATPACQEYMQTGKISEALLNDHMPQALANLETHEGRRLGDPEKPLLVSVRSGAPMSMPGMMDTVLNVGMTAQVAFHQGQKWANNPQMLINTYDTYYRFLESYTDAVMSPSLTLEQQKAVDAALGDIKANLDYYRENPQDANHEEMKAICIENCQGIQKATGQIFPQTADGQLKNCVEAVMKSWNSERAVAYRAEHGIPDGMGTAVTVQTMVMGNLPHMSGAGVLFTRNTTTGEPEMTGNFVVGGQGNDVVAGTASNVSHIDALKALKPEAYESLTNFAQILETKHGRAQEIEFCLENGKMYVLQTRDALCTPEAEVRITMDLLEEKLTKAVLSPIDQDVDIEGEYLEALAQIDKIDKTKLLTARVQPEALAKADVLAQGENLCSTAVSGVAVFNETQIAHETARGRRTIFIASGNRCGDYTKVKDASGTLAIGGNASSHAAVTARAMGKAYVSGVEGNIEDSSLTLPDGTVINNGDKITLGEDGQVIVGELPLEQKPLSPALEKVIEADSCYRDGYYSTLLVNNSPQQQVEAAPARTVSRVQENAIER